MEYLKGCTIEYDEAGIYVYRDTQCLFKIQLKLFSPFYNETGDDSTWTAEEIAKFITTTLETKINQNEVNH